MNNIEKQNIPLPHENELMQLRNFWKVGIDSGSGRFADMAEIKAEARKQFLLKNAE